MGDKGTGRVTADKQAGLSGMCDCACVPTYEHICVTEKKMREKYLTVLGEGSGGYPVETEVEVKILENDVRVEGYRVIFESR